MASVVFDPTSFKLRYPEFVNVDNGLLTLFFDEATLYLSNKDNSPVQNIARRTMLLNMLVAHIAAINGKLNAGGIPGPVGRVSSATEGSVSISTEYLLPGTHAWFSQTVYGSSFWQATVALRSFRYVSCPTRY
jgi:hypothetical protein